MVDREDTKSTYRQSSFIGNEASQDGGASYEDYGSHVAFERAQFERNRARHQGGAIYLLSRASQLEATIVSVDQSRFVGNKARGGASIYSLDDSTLTIKGSKYPAHLVHNPAATK